MVSCWSCFSFDAPGFDVHDGNWDYRPDHIIDIQIGVLYFSEDDAYDLAKEASEVIYGQGSAVSCYVTTLCLFLYLQSEDGDLVMTELLFRGFDAANETDPRFTEVLSSIFGLASFNVAVCYL